MYKLITIFSLTFCLISKAQVFTGTGGAILNNGQDTYFPLSVSGLSPALIDSTFGLEQICFNINHPAVSELYIYLQSPSGNIVELTLGSSNNGANFSNTCLDHISGTSITLGNAPYTGSFSPVGFLGRFNTSQAGNGTWNLIVHDGFPVINAGTLISWNIKFGNAPAHPVIFKSSNLPIVVLTTGSAISNATTLISMGIIDNGPNRNYRTDPFNNYNQKARISWHGSSTKNFEKKSYNFQTSNTFGGQIDVSLLGMPVENDWGLLAPYQDKSLIRIPLTYDLFRKMGHYAARLKNVEVILNNEYQGSYILSEKVKRDSNRVHVNKMAITDNSFPNITGGYIIKIDRSDSPGWYSLFPGNAPNNKKFYYQYDYPKSVDITVAQKNYLKSYVDSFEVAMNSITYTDPIIGYQKYIHTGSFIDYFIINELSKNVDAYRLSTYIYKDRITHGGKLHIGPVWDYDIAWHNCNYALASSAAGWQYQLQDTASPSPMWWTRFMQDTNFVNSLHCRWKDLRQNILSINSLNNYIDSSATALNESQQRNFRQWPILGAFIYPNPQNQTGANYAGEVADLKTWVANRIAWLDANILGACSTVGIKEEMVVNNLIIYPNPMQSSVTFSMKLERNSDVSLCITDLLGKEVKRFMNANEPQGDSKIVFERNQIQAGVYLYQLQIDNAIKTGKIIIQ